MGAKKKPIGKPLKDLTALTRKTKRYIDGDWEKSGAVFPSIAGLSRYVKIPRQTLRSYADTHPDYAVTLEDLLALQEEMLLGKGLSGEWNSNIAKLVLSSCHGYSDKVEKNVKKKTAIKVERVLVKASKK